MLLSNLQKLGCPALLIVSWTFTDPTGKALPRLNFVGGNLPDYNFPGCRLPGYEEMTVAAVVVVAAAGKMRLVVVAAVVAPVSDNNEPRDQLSGSCFKCQKCIPSFAAARISPSQVSVPPWQT